jgi:hypothetical protein
MAGGQFETVAIPKRIQLVASPGYRFNDFNIDSQLVNCFAEKDLNDGEYWVQKRPCFTAQTLAPASSGANPARGIYRFQGYNAGSSAYRFLVVNNARLSYLNQSASTTTLIGNIANAQTNYAFETVRSTPNFTAVLNDGGNAYYTDTATITSMTGLANFPANTVRGWAYLDGTLYVMTQLNQIYGSANLDDPTVWDPLNVIIARNGSDSAVALCKHKEYVMALKETSCEFFYNAANPTGSPLSSLRGSKIPYGCANAYTVQSIDDETLWVSRGEGGIYQIIRLTNLRPTVVSTPAIDRILRDFNGFTGTGSSLLTSSFQLKLGGHRYYGVNIPVAIFNYVTGLTTSTFVTLVYDLDERLWYRWSNASGSSSWEVSGTAGPDDTRRVVMQNYLTGNIHILAEDYIQSTDAGTAPLVDVYTVDHDFGTQRTKQLGAMYFRGNMVSGSTLKLRFSDDDFNSWSSFRELDLSKQRPALTDCGSFYRRAWNLRHQSPTPFRLKTTDLQLDIGTI